MPRASSRSGPIAAVASLVTAAVLVSATAAGAQRSPSPSPVITTNLRSPTEPRPVAAIVAQTELESSIELGRIAGPNAGNSGALGALIILAMDHTTERLTEAAKNRAEGQIMPLRAALAGFDSNSLILQATRTAVTAAPGFDPELVELVSVPANMAEDTPNPQRGFALAHPQARSLGFLNWRYQTSPDFSQIQVIVNVEIANSAGLARQYRQQLISIVKLNRPSMVAEENVARWSANGGDLARRGLEMAIGRVGQTLPRIIALDETAYRHATDRRRTDRVIAAGFHGPVLLQDSAGPVFWATDSDQGLAAFVAVQTLGEQPAP